MIKVKSSISMDLGQKYLFRLADGSTWEIVIRGSRVTASGDMLDIEIDGKVGEYAGLNDAIGAFIGFSAV